MCRRHTWICFWGALWSFVIEQVLEKLAVEGGQNGSRERPACFGVSKVHQCDECGTRDGELRAGIDGSQNTPFGFPLRRAHLPSRLCVLHVRQHLSSSSDARARTHPSHCSTCVAREPSTSLGRAPVLLSLLSRDPTAPSRPGGGTCHVIGCETSSVHNRGGGRVRPYRTRRRREVLVERTTSWRPWKHALGSARRPIRAASDGKYGMDRPRDWCWRKPAWVYLPRFIHQEPARQEG
mmetsp:Transcript_3519/g.22133  ORF Transcript_3519/g.22133 Transcript_3519/m.22133 type:complete len:237 (+) Transcript_3519:1203-1913(+)